MPAEVYSRYPHTENAGAGEQVGQHNLTRSGMSSCLQRRGLYNPAQPGTTEALGPVSFLTRDSYSSGKARGGLPAQETLKLENRAEWEGRAEDRSKVNLLLCPYVVSVDCVTSKFSVAAARGPRLLVRSQITNATRRTEYIQAYQAADVNRRREKLAEKLFREEQELQQELLEQQVFSRTCICSAIQS